MSLLRCLKFLESGKIENEEYSFKIMTADKFPNIGCLIATDKMKK